MTDMAVLGLLIPVINCILICTGNWEQIAVLLIMSIYSDSDEKFEGFAFASLSTATMLGVWYSSVELIMICYVVWGVIAMFRFIYLLCYD